MFIWKDLYTYLNYLKDMKINLTEKQIEVIERALDLNFISNNLEELKEDKEFYEDYKECRKYAIQIMKKIMIYKVKNNDK